MDEIARPAGRLGVAIPAVEGRLPADHVDGAADRVLQRNDAVRGALLYDGFEDLIEALAGHRFNLRSAVHQRGGFAVRAGLSLIRESQRSCLLRAAAAAAAARTYRIWSCPARPTGNPTSPGRTLIAS